MWGFFHKHGHAKKHNRRKIYTHNIAAAIVDEFEEVLDEYDITVPDESREGNDDEARLYGDVYDKLLTNVEKGLLPLLAPAATMMKLSLSTTYSSEVIV